jgi:hypothetical protein
MRKTGYSPHIMRPTSGDIGEAIATEMFGADPVGTAVDLAEDLSWEEVSSVLKSVLSALDAIRPKMVSWDVNVGEDADGQQYAEVTINTTDPVGLVQKSLPPIISRATARGLTVMMEPLADDKVTIMFSTSKLYLPGD